MTDHRKTFEEWKREYIALMQRAKWSQRAIDSINWNYMQKEYYGKNTDTIDAYENEHQY
jgi:hypothetical protein